MTAPFDCSALVRNVYKQLVPRRRRIAIWLRRKAIALGGRS